MKKPLNKKTFWQSLLSITSLGLFVLTAVGSLYLFGIDMEIERQTEYLDNGVYQDTRKLTEYYTRVTGKHDAKGRWSGPIKVEDAYYGGEIYRTEEYTVVNGSRHGKSKITWSHGYVQDICYNMGYVIDCKKSASISEASVSAFQVLSNKYPWFLSSLNAYGFEDEYVETYTDTLETVLGTYAIEELGFDDAYGDVISDLEETPYDSIITLNSVLSYFQGTEELKNSELRLAVIDRYRSDGKSTFNNVSSTYPNYLRSISDVGLKDQDFEGFCEVLDSCMTSYGSLDLEDPFFIDSVDAYIFRALFTILAYEEPDTSTLKSTKFSTLSELIHVINSSPIDSSTVAVSSVVLYFMLLQYDQSDILKRAVLEAYLENNGVISVPAVTTEFLDNNSATMATVQGYVIEDGGAEITSRGVALATFYNPTTDDQIEPSGTGTGEYVVTLGGLTEGVTYYARAYATNSAGTAYGKSVSFTTSGTSGIEFGEFDHDFTIYPNPSAGQTTFSFRSETLENFAISIINLKGQIVYSHDLGRVSPGENRVELDLSDLKSGIYNCQLSNNGTMKTTRKFVVIH